MFGVEYGMCGWRLGCKTGLRDPRYAVGLQRVSTAEQGQSRLDLEAQQASVRSFAAAQGWTLVAEFSDAIGVSDPRRLAIVRRLPVRGTKVCGAVIGAGLATPRSTREWPPRSSAP